MKKYLLFFSFLTIFLLNDVFAQPATFGIPVSIGRNNCGTIGAAPYNYIHTNGQDNAHSFDSVYFFNYVSPNLTWSTIRYAYFP